MVAPGVMGVVAVGFARHGWLPAGDCGWRGHPAEPGMVGGVAGEKYTVRPATQPRPDRLEVRVSLFTCPC